MTNFFSNISKWIVENFWNLFGVVGVIGTFYFSLFYVPDYVKQIATSKSNIMHENLMDNVQELIFYDQIVDINDIETLIIGKELSQGVKYPFSINELLIQVQERFMGNKFVPLEKRKSLIERIDSLRKENPTSEQKDESKFDWTSILPWIMSGLGIFISILGAVSLSDKFRRDKEVEADIGYNVNDNIVINDHYSSSFSSMNAALEYEKLIGQLLKELGAEIMSQEKSGPDKAVTMPDYMIGTVNGDFLVECKRHRRLIGLNTISQFLYQTMEHGKKGIFVTTSELTKRSIETVHKHNNANTDIKVFIVQGTNREELKIQLRNIICKTASNK